MKNILSALVIVAFALTACNNSTEPQLVEPASADNTGMLNNPPLGTDSPTQVSPAMNSETLSSTTTPDGAQQAPTAPAQTTTAPGANPPHGQPGHRCDINVGAPLDSPPGNTSAPTPAPTMAPQSPSTGMPTPSFAPKPLSPISAPPPAPSTPPGPAPAPVVTAPGMNPPHGQPGHDCAIAVGAPLKK